MLKVTVNNTILEYGNGENMIIVNFVKKYKTQILNDILEVLNKNEFDDISLLDNKLIWLFDDGNIVECLLTLE